MDPIKIQSTIQAPLAKVWQCYVTPAHITQWNFAVPEWHCPHAENDLRVGGKFTYRMEARNVSFGFDFGGLYAQIIEGELIEYVLEDGRKVSVNFEGNDSQTILTQVFEPENQNPPEMQQQGWQAILDNFRVYVEK